MPPWNLDSLLWIQYLINKIILNEIGRTVLLALREHQSRQVVSLGRCWEGDEEHERDFASLAFYIRAEETGNGSWQVATQ